MAVSLDREDEMRIKWREEDIDRCSYCGKKIWTRLRAFYLFCSEFCRTKYIKRKKLKERLEVVEER